MCREGNPGGGVGMAVRERLCVCLWGRDVLGGRDVWEGRGR